MELYIGVFAYNEERLIGACLDSILGQDFSCVDGVRVLVVSSGSTDGTNGIVREFERRDSRVELIVQDERRGKASAINEFLSRVPANGLCALVSADVILEGRDCMCKMVRRFEDQGVGMVTSHPVPVNSTNTLMGKIVWVLWEMKHRVSLIEPKTGEVVLFRKVFEKMPEDVLVDEAYVEWEIARRGLRIEYEPGAVVRNKGPETIGDFIKQRRRIYVGHKLLERRLGYRGSTFDIGLLFKIMFEIARERPDYIPALVGAVALETWARVLGRVDLLLGRYDTHGRWEMVETSKSM